MIFLFLLTVLVITVLQYYWKHRKFYQVYNKLPLVHSHLPLLGVIHKFYNVDSEKLYNTVKLLTSSGPSPRRVNAGLLCFVVVDDAAQVQTVLNSKFCGDKGYFYKNFILNRG